MIVCCAFVLFSLVNIHMLVHNVRGENDIQVYRHHEAYSNNALTAKKESVDRIEEIQEDSKFQLIERYPIYQHQDRGENYIAISMIILFIEVHLPFIG